MYIDFQRNDTINLLRWERGEWNETNAFIRRATGNVKCREKQRKSFVSSEENVWKLCERWKQNDPNSLDHLSAVFISNARRQIPIWEQKSATNPEHLVLWVRMLAVMCSPTMSTFLPGLSCDTDRSIISFCVGLRFWFDTSVSCVCLRLSANRYSRGDKHGTPISSVTFSTPSICWWLTSSISDGFEWSLLKSISMFSHPIDLTCWKKIESPTIHRRLPIHRSVLYNRRIISRTSSICNPTTDQERWWT